MQMAISRLEMTAVQTSNLPEDIGLVGVLQKPFSINVLLEVLQKHLPG